jgi:uncharacterized protein (UPF0303 family)
MARIKVEEVVEKLELEIRSALKETLKGVAPDIKIDSHNLFRTFKHALRKECSEWEEVSDHSVQIEK